MSPERPIAIAPAVVGMTWAAAGLHAEACEGLPQGSRGGFAFGLAFPEEPKSYGISGIRSREEGGLYLGGSFGVTSDDLQDLENEKDVGGLLACQISSLARGASLCLTVGALYSWIEDVSSWSIPSGVGLGKTLKLEGGGTALTPYVIPQFLYV